MEEDVGEGSLWAGDGKDYYLEGAGMIVKSPLLSLAHESSTGNFMVGRAQPSQGMPTPSGHVNANAKGSGKAGGRRMEMSRRQGPCFSVGTEPRGRDVPLVLDEEDPFFLFVPSTLSLAGAADTGERKLVAVGPDGRDPDNTTWTLDHRSLPLLLL